MQENRIIEDILDANPNPYLDRSVGLSIDFFDVMEINYDNWPAAVKKIVKKRGGIEFLRIKDIIEIELILNHQIIKIEK